MARIIGRLTSIGIGKETTRGTSVAPTYWVPIRGLDFDDNLERKENESGYGVLSATSDSQIIKEWSEGSFDGKVFDKSFGVIMTLLFGQSPTSVQRGATGVYDHTWAMLATNQHKTATLGIKEANNDLRYAMATLDSLKIEAVLDDYLRYTADFVAKKGASASNTVAYAAENEFIPKHANVYFATTLAGLAGASASKVRSFTLDIKKNAEGLQVLGNTGLDDIANKQVEVSGSIELYYDSLTNRNLAFNNTSNALRLEVINTDTIIGSGSDNPAFRFDLAKCKFSWNRDFDNNDIMTETLEFTGHFSLSDAAQIAGRLTNAYAGTNY